MSDATSHPPNCRTTLRRVGLALSLLAVLGLPAGQAMAAKPPVTLVQPSSTGDAKTARQALLKKRAAIVAARKPHPGKTVGGTTTPLPKTIVTKRTSS